MRKNNIEHLKSFLSKTSDKGRRAWRKLPEEVPRRFVFFGTTNEDRFLRDTTGTLAYPTELCEGVVRLFRENRAGYASDTAA
jgi:predicted P-loop ATPase